MLRFSLRLPVTFLACAALFAGCASDPASGTYKVGQPYQINGKWYYPAEDPNYDEVGMASWYGRKFHGLTTANGERYNMNAMTAAHPTLPLPSIARVTNLENGKSVILRLNDRGPFAKDRLIDVSRAAATELGFKEQGVAKVRVQYLGPANVDDATVRMAATAASNVLQTPIEVAAPAPQTSGAETAANASGAASAAPQPLVVPPPGQTPPPQPVYPAPPPNRTVQPVLAGMAPVVEAQAAVPPPSSQTISALQGGHYVQAASFSSRANADAARARLASLGATEIALASVREKTYYRVRVGPFTTAVEAENRLSAVRAAGFSDARVVSP